MAKKNKKYVGCIIEGDELHPIKILATHLNTVPHVVVKKAIKKFLEEYESTDEFPKEFRLYCLAMKAKYAMIEKELEDIRNVS